MGGGGRIDSTAQAFSGPGRRLGGGDGSRDEFDASAFMRDDADESDEEELMLARAISASLETAKAASTPGIERYHRLITTSSTLLLTTLLQYSSISSPTFTNIY